MPSSTGQQSSRYRYRFGGAILDESEMQLYLGGRRVDLERRPIELLLVFLTHADEAMTKDELLDTVWQGQTTVENVLANAVTKLRRALGAELATRIVTLPRIGYRFEGPVERIAAGRKHLSQLKLAVGAQTPLRSQFILKEQLSTREGREVWRAAHHKTGEARVFKFASNGFALASLKREVTLYRLMLSALGERAPIVTIYDWNFEKEPFFIESADGGIDLVRWHRDTSEFAGGSFSERLNLCLSISEAIGHAHSAGVLHKDLKPSNIIISDEGVPSLVDFGSGELLSGERLEKAQITPLGWTHDDQNPSLESTPIYTAPEVFESAQYSVLSDVYALGVITYQIMSGHILKPMAPGWEKDIDDDILIEDIAAATQTDPSNRLATAQAFAESLRSLDERRVAASEARARTARAEDLEKKLERSRMRRPWLIATVASLIIGLALSVLFAVDASSARSEAERRAVQAELAREYLLETLYYTTPAIDGGEANDVWARALDRAETQLGEISTNDPDAYAALSLAAGRIREGSGNSEAAILHFSNAAATYRLIEKENSPRLVESELRHAFNLLQLGRIMDAEPILERAIDRLRKIRTPRFELRYLALDVQANLAGRKSQNEQAKSLYNRQIEMYEKSDDHKRRSLEYRNDYDRWSRSRLHLAQYLSLSGDLEIARKTIRPVLEKIDQGGAEVNDHAMLNALFMSANISLAASEYKQSISSANAAKDIATQLYGPHNYYVEQLQLYIASAHFQLREFHAAAGVSRDAIESVCIDFSEPSTTCIAHHDLFAKSLFYLGERAEAKTSFETLLEHHRKNSGEDSADAMRSMYFLAHSALDERRLDDAQEYFSRIDFEMLAQKDDKTQWKELEAASDARFNFFLDPSDETVWILEAKIEAMRQAGASSAEVAIFERDLQSVMD